MTLFTLSRDENWDMATSMQKNIATDETGTVKNYADYKSAIVVLGFGHCNCPSFQRVFREKYKDMNMIPII